MHDMSGNARGTTATASLRLDVFTSPLFLTSLLVLAVNDFLLKERVPGLLTGKLSDFAGLFAFTVFWWAFFPGRNRAVVAAIGAAFAIWKLPLAQPAIDFWNAHAPFRLGRTVDPTDLMALAVIPAAVLYARSLEVTPPRRSATVVLVAASAIAFIATSYRTSFDYTETYVYAGTPTQFLKALEDRGIGMYPDASVKESEYWLHIPSDLCFDRIDGYVTVTAHGAETHVHLTRLTHRCPEGRDAKRRLQREFTRAVVEPLRLRPVA